MRNELGRLLVGAALATTMVAATALAVSVPSESVGTDVAVPYESFVEASNGEGLESRGLFRKKWKAQESVHNAEEGYWVAVVNDPRTGKNEDVGHFGSREEADQEASAFADFANNQGVVDGPGCNLPGVLC